MAQLMSQFGATERGLKMKLTSEGISESARPPPDVQPGARAYTSSCRPVAKDYRKDDKKWVQI